MTPRNLTAHRVNPLNDMIEIYVIDEPGAGGANHEYLVDIGDKGAGVTLTRITFQKGPIAEAGVNGLTQEVLLAIVKDRLECFQKGAYSCRENALALTKIEEAMHWLHSRTLDRMQRGVEGTSNK